MIVRFRLAGLAIAASLSIAAGLFVIPEEAASETWKITNVKPSGRVHLRKRASSRSRILTYIPGNARGLKSKRCRRKWCQIKFGKHKGWVFRRYLTPDNKPQTKPVPATPELTALSKKKVLKLTNSDDRPIAVYAFPSETLPSAGLLPAGTETVEGLGICVPNWCYIRSGGLLGWLPQTIIAAEEEAGKAEETTASLGGMPAQNAQETITTVNTATRADIEAETITQPPSVEGSKLYTLAGIVGDSSLPMHAKAGESSPILGWIPKDARTVEGLRKCEGKWCMVRWENKAGWVARRHLADLSLENSQTFKVSGLPLWSPLDVLDQPSADAAVVGAIPSYATGIVPIGGCDDKWCHIRYLGVAGWVGAEHLQPQKH